ncbi:hypothetical protein [Schleiferilactobacillus harbinensis]|uniref:hypothetical protein n=1 Tax=Schleiferilactobacillus harbinensis TaxID=304207 RepID=UPI0004868970|nr:hypothetical protein [Schleiferilactobacillus harbinensis]
MIQFVLRHKFLSIVLALLFFGLFFLSKAFAATIGSIFGVLFTVAMIGLIILILWPVIQFVFYFIMGCVLIFLIIGWILSW